MDQRAHYALREQRIRWQVSIWSVWRGNKQDAKTVGEFLTHAVHWIRNGGNVANCEATLADGTRIELSLKRVTQIDASAERQP